MWIDVAVDLECFADLVEYVAAVKFGCLDDSFGHDSNYLNYVIADWVDDRRMLVALRRLIRLHSVERDRLVDRYYWMVIRAAMNLAFVGHKILEFDFFFILKKKIQI